MSRPRLGLGRAAVEVPFVSYAERELFVLRIL